MNKSIALLTSLFIILGFSACSNQAQEEKSSDATDVINEEDYLRFANSSLEAYKIACFAVKNGDWIFAAQKWSEGDELSEQEGKLVAQGLTQAMNERLQKGENAKWNGAPAEETISKACSQISSR